MENMRKYAEKHRRTKSEKSRNKYRAHMENLVGYAIVAAAPSAYIDELRAMRNRALAD